MSRDNDNGNTMDAADLQANGGGRARGDIHVYDLFVAVVAVFAIGLISYRLTLDDASELARLIDWFDLLICGLFFTDFLRSLALAPNRVRYLTTWGVFDLLSSIPVVQPLRWARLARLLRVIRILKSATLIWTAVRRERRTAILLGVIAFTVAAVMLSCIGVLRAEASADHGNIRTAGDALWWSFVTVTTVGYGDHYPVTDAGKLLAALLMCVGIGMFASFAGLTADVLRALSRDDRDAETAHADAVAADISTQLVELRHQLDELRAQLRR